MAGTESARIYRSPFAGAVLRMQREKWKQHCRGRSRASCVGIAGQVERRLPDRSGWSIRLPVYPKGFRASPLAPRGSTTHGKDVMAPSTGWEPLREFATMQD